MGTKFASAKYAIAECDRCGFRFKLTELKSSVLKVKPYNLRVCRACWDPDHPQLQLGMYPVFDPQAVRDARPDKSFVYSGLMLDGSAGVGSRITQWGWAPVGGARAFDAALTPNNLVSTIMLGSVNVVTT